MIVHSIEQNGDTVLVIFASYLKEDYVERLLRVTITGELATHLYFSSNDHGTASWARGRGIVDSHRWETEDDLVRVSYLSRRYPVLIENGAVSPDFALEKIIPDVLGQLLDPELSRALSSMVASPPGEFPEPDWDKVLSRNVTLSEQFVEDLIAGNERDPGSTVDGGREIHSKNEGREARSVRKGKALPLKHIAERAAIIAGKAVSLMKKAFSRNTAADESTRGEIRSGGAKDYLARARELSRKIKKM